MLDTLCLRYVAPIVGIRVYLSLQCLIMQRSGIIKKSIRVENRSKVVSEYHVFIGICPNGQCHGIVFFVVVGGEVKKTFPPEQIDFEVDGIPPHLVKTLEESIHCHSIGAYKASAIMVRRLLEEICDENGAEGKYLHDRLVSLKSRVILPDVLFDAMTELQALGNDAAHVEAKAYDEIGKDEAEDSIALAKEILKALYQLQSLVGRLQARKKKT